MAGADGKARVYGTDGQMQELFVHDGPAVAAAFLPDGKHLVTASADKTARTWTPALEPPTCSEVRPGNTPMRYVPHWAKMFWMAWPKPAPPS